MSREIRGSIDESKPRNLMSWYIATFSVVMLTCTFVIYKKWEEQQSEPQEIIYEQQVPEQIVELEQRDPAEDYVSYDFTYEEQYVEVQPEILSQYQELYAVNNDIVGFIYLNEGYSYPVMQRVQDQNYYLNKNFREENDLEGIPFANRYCTLGEPGLTLLYGHTLKSGHQFSCLKYFKEEDYFNEHRYMQIDTLYEEMQYEVVAVALTSLHEEFEYYLYVGDVTETDFNDWKSGFSEYIIRGSLEDLSYGDIIVELSTCSYQTEDGRIVVILKAVS